MVILSNNILQKVLQSFKKKKVYTGVDPEKFGPYLGLVHINPFDKKCPLTKLNFIKMCTV